MPKKKRKRYSIRLTQSAAVKLARELNYAVLTFSPGDDFAVVAQTLLRRLRPNKIKLGERRTISLTRTSAKYASILMSTLVLLTSTYKPTCRYFLGRFEAIHGKICGPC